MKLAQFGIVTLRETPREAVIKSHQLMLQSGMIKKVGLGLYSFQPLGMRVLHRVTDIVRKKMNESGALEIALPLVQPAELWHETNRYEKYGPELLKFNDRGNHEHCLGPTHEEVITDMARQIITHRRQLPFNWYQIQTKFRDEIRPRFGIMRAREFLMKDAYSFHETEKSLNETYELMAHTYQAIFEACQLSFVKAEADTGATGGSASHEFHVTADTGEDALVMLEDKMFNTETLEYFDINNPSTHHTPNGIPLTVSRGIEVGHIFKLGDQYSRAMNFSLMGDSGESFYPLSGCYGIGVSRIIAAAIEQNHDESGIIWQANLAPFTVAIAMVNPEKNESVVSTGNHIYQQCLKHSINVALDDRGLRIGAMLNDLELLGIPVTIIIGNKNLKDGMVEIKMRSGESRLCPANEVVAQLNNL